MKQVLMLKLGLFVLVTGSLCACSVEEAATGADFAVADTASEESSWDVPDWSGIWFAEGLDADISGFPVGGPGAIDLNAFKLLGVSAPWNETGQERFAAMLEVTFEGSRKADGWGFPMMMNGHAPLQFLVTPKETLIINMYRDARHVYTDGRAHPPEIDRWVTTWGDSVGYWEGDTLVIDTVWVRDPTTFFWFSPPFSDQARYVERIRMTAPDRIESEFTIEDPVTLSEPWVVNVAYLKTPGLDRLIHDDFTNDRSELDENRVFSIEPAAQ